MAALVRTANGVVGIMGAGAAVLEQPLRRDRKQGVVELLDEEA
jgi:hypothetical protein